MFKSYIKFYLFVMTLGGLWFPQNVTASPAIDQLVSVIREKPGMTVLPKIQKIYDEAKGVDDKFNRTVAQYLGWGKIIKPANGKNMSPETIPPSKIDQYFISEIKADAKGFEDYFRVLFAGDQKLNSAIYSYILNPNLSPNAPSLVTKTHIPALYAYSGMAIAIKQYYEMCKKGTINFNWDGFVKSDLFKQYEQNINDQLHKINPNIKITSALLEKKLGNFDPFALLKVCEKEHFQKQEEERLRNEKERLQRLMQEEEMIQREIERLQKEEKEEDERLRKQKELAISNNSNSEQNKETIELEKLGKSLELEVKKNVVEELVSIASESDVPLNRREARDILDKHIFSKWNTLDLNIKKEIISKVYRIALSPTVISTYALTLLDQGLFSHWKDLGQESKTMVMKASSDIAIFSKKTTFQEEVLEILNKHLLSNWHNLTESDQKEVINTFSNIATNSFTRKIAEKAITILDKQFFRKYWSLSIISIMKHFINELSDIASNAEHEDISEQAMSLLYQCTLSFSSKSGTVQKAIQETLKIIAVNSKYKSIRQEAKRQLEYYED